MLTEAVVANTDLQRASTPLFRRHANSAVESDDFAVQHFVFEDMPHERGEFGWTAKPRREGHLLGERFAGGLGQTGEQGSVEGPWGNRHDANPHTRELARQRQRQSDDPALGRGVGGLADLAIERRDDAVLTITPRSPVSMAGLTTWPRPQVEQR